MAVHTIGLMTFGEKITRLCRERNWKAADLARNLKISKTTAGLWMDGQRKPYDDKLTEISKLLGVDPGYLVSDELDEVPAQPTPAGPELTEDERFILRVVRANRIDADEAIRRLTGNGDGEAGQGARPQPKPPAQPPAVPLVPKIPKGVWGRPDASGEQELDVAPLVADLRREKEERKKKGPGGKGPKGE